MDRAGVETHGIDRRFPHKLDERRHDVTAAIGSARGPLDEFPLGPLPPEHVVVAERGDEFRRHRLRERFSRCARRRIVHDPPDPPVRLVAEWRDVRPPLAGLEAGRRRIVLDDVVVPVDHPDLAVRPHVSSNRRRPLVVASHEIPGHAAGEGGALFHELKGGDNVPGRLADEGRAVPVFLGIGPGGVETVAGGSGEPAVVIDLPDGDRFARSGSLRGQFHLGATGDAGERGRTPAADAFIHAIRERHVFARIAVGRRTEDKPLFAEAESPGVVVGAAEKFELRPVRPQAPEAGAKPQRFAADGALESGISHDAVHPAIEAPGEVTRAGVRVAGAPSTEEHLSQVGLAVAVGVLEEEHVRGLRHDQTTVVGQHARGYRQILGKHGASVSLAVAIAVDECHNPVVARNLGRRIFLRWLDEIVGVIDTLCHGECAIGIEGLRQGLALEQRLRRKQLHLKTLGRDRMLPRLLRFERFLHVREWLILLRGIVAGWRIKGHLGRLIGEALDPRRWLRHCGMIDIRSRRRGIAARCEADAAFDEIVKPWMAPGPLVVAPRRVEDTALPLGADPGPRLTLVALDPFLEHGPAAVVVLRVDVGLVPACEAAKPLHHRMRWRDVDRATFTGAVLLKLCPDEVDPRGRIAETKTRAVQRHEPLAIPDEIEDRRLGRRRQRVDVGVDGQRVVGGEHLRIEIRDLVCVNEFDAPRREHRFELRKPLGWLVVPAIAQKQHLDGWLSPRRHGNRAKDDAGQQQAMDHDKLHSGSFMIAPPFIADSCARMPVQVQLALCFALGYGSRPSASAVTNSCTRCGWLPPWPPP